MLIIGGVGFVGRNLTQYLQSLGHEVAVLDRILQSDTPNHLQAYQGDAQDPNCVHEVLVDFNPDVVYHLAANSDISAGIADAALDFGDTLMTTISVCQACELYGVQELVFASSSAIFGRVDGPISENIESFYLPESWYGKAKLTSEFALEAFSIRNPHTKVLITRFPNVVGPLATHGVVFDFINRLLADSKTLHVLGDGYQQKPYVHVADLIRGMEFFRAQLVSGVMERINIGPPDTLTVRDIAIEVTKAMSCNPEVIYQEQPTGWPGDIPKYEFDSNLMASRGFEIQATSREAVARAAKELVRELGRNGI